MIADLNGVPLDQALTALKEQVRLHPGNPTELLSVAEQICAWADEHRIRDLAQIVDLCATRLLQDLAQTGSLDPTLDDEDDDFDGPRRDEKAIGRLHLARNTLIALRSATLLAVAQPHWRRMHRPGTATADAGIASVAPRTPFRTAPATDEEIFIVRLAIELALHEGANLGPINAYLLAESGFPVAAATSAIAGHLRNPRRPGQPMSAARVGEDGGLKEPIELTSYASATLRRTLGTSPAPEQRLCYDGAFPIESRNRAHGSLDRAIRRILHRAGLRGPGVTTRGITLWRPSGLIRHDLDLSRACAVYGALPVKDDPAVRVLAALHYTEDERQLHRGIRGIRDHLGRLVARIPTAG